MKPVALDTTSPFGQRSASLWSTLVWTLCEWRALSSSVRRRLRKRFARQHPGPFDVRAQGLNMRLYPAENYCDRVLFARGDLPERTEHDALLPHLKPGMVFVDIGANVGSYSAFVGTRVKGDVTILCFEPHPRTVEKLRFNLSAKGLSTDQIINAGVAGARGTMDLWSDGGGNVGHTSLLPAGTANAAIRHEVKVVTLADTLSEQGIDRIDVLKIDIEGFEDQALMPFFKTAESGLWPKVVLLETAHQAIWKENLIIALNERGYRETFSTAENIILVRQEGT